MSHFIKCFTAFQTDPVLFKNTKMSEYKGHGNFERFTPPSRLAQI